MEHALTTASLVCGVVGSLFLSYDLLGKSGGPVRACVVALSLAIVSTLVAGASVLAVAQVFPPQAPSPVEALLFSTNLLYFYFGVGFLGGLVLYRSFAHGELRTLGTTEQREQRSTLIVVGALLLLGLIGYLAASGYQRTSNPNYFLDYGAFLVSFFLLIPIGALVLRRVLRWVDTFQERQLGSFGTLLTLLAFGIQLAFAAR